MDFAIGASDRRACALPDVLRASLVPAVLRSAVTVFFKGRSVIGESGVGGDVKSVRNATKASSSVFCAGVRRLRIEMPAWVSGL